jgi:hypothetical protein
MRIRHSKIKKEQIMAVKHWGNNTGDPGYRGDEDWESNPAYKNILKINDVNDGNDDKIALHTKNSSTDGEARALKIATL